MQKELFTLAILGFYWLVYTLIEKYWIDGNYKMSNNPQSSSLIEDNEDEEKYLLDIRGISKTYRGFDLWNSTKAIKNLKN